MAKTDYRSFDEYVAAQPERAGSALREVRRAILSAVPGADGD